MENILSNIRQGGGEVVVNTENRNRIGISKFERIYEKHKKVMYKEAYNVLQNSHDVEDAVQQACLRLLQCAERIKEDEVGMTCNFIKIVVRNVAKDLYRDKIYLNTKEDAIDMLADDWTRMCRIGVVDLVIDKENVGRIVKAIDNLPEKCRDILLLEKVFGYSREETMILLGESYETLKKRMTRAKTKLLEALRKEDLDDGRENIGKVTR